MCTVSVCWSFQMHIEMYFSVLEKKEGNVLLHSLCENQTL
jgi:hypothetical protein